MRKPKESVSFAGAKLKFALPQSWFSQIKYSLVARRTQAAVIWETNLELGAARRTVGKGQEMKQIWPK